MALIKGLRVKVLPFK
ncbi:Protein of unknown function [Lactobacillus delbrueckii subsp. lactis]|nr:Protein of unknown function [Lactobacillus delbrueckii subsp. lactis]